VKDLQPHANPFDKIRPQIPRIVVLEEVEQRFAAETDDHTKVPV